MSSRAGFFKRWFALGILKCVRTRRLLFDYAEGRLDPETSRRLEEHLSDCPHCLEYTRSYRQTISLYRKHYPRPAMPLELRKKLEEFIQAQ